MSALRRYGIAAGLAVVAGLIAGCQSTSTGASHTHGHGHVGVGYYGGYGHWDDDWYPYPCCGGDVIVVPPDQRPERPPPNARPEHPIARPPVARPPRPSIPSRPRPMPRRR